jgi:cytoskeletal protein CcmA (bactofilin family)
MQMFSNNRRSDPAATPTEPLRTPSTPQPVQRTTTPSHARSGGMFSAGVAIKGTVKFQNELLIDGEVEGSIESPGVLTIGKQACIKGEIKVRSVTVQGTVEGNISAAERCELQAGCTLRGDIEAPRLIVDENATFFGSAKIATKKSAQED